MQEYGMGPGATRKRHRKPLARGGAAVACLLAWAAASRDAPADETAPWPVPLRSETVVDFVGRLPREIARNRTFVYRSRSFFRDSITARFPRVVLFSDDGRKIYSFTGDPSRPGSDLIETLTFDDRSARFVPGIFQLRPAVGGRPTPAVKMPTEQGCANCHGADIRPIFDAYPLWPGFFGSFRDTFALGTKQGRTELARYRAFLRGSGGQGVYAALRMDHRAYPLEPYLPPERSAAPDLGARLDNLRASPNTRLGMALTRLNRARIRRKLADAHLTPAALARAARQVLGCADDAPAPAAFRADLVARLHRESIARIQRMEVAPADPEASRLEMVERQFVDGATAVQWAARGLGVSTADWSLAMEPSALAVFDGRQSGPKDGRSAPYVREELLIPLFELLAPVSPLIHADFVRSPDYAELGYPFGDGIEWEAARKTCYSRALPGAAN